MEGNKMIREMKAGFFEKDLFTEQEKAVFSQQLDLFCQHMMLYNSAVRTMETKLNILNDELKMKYQSDAIQSIKSRIKSPVSISDKLKRKGYSVTVENMAQHLTDVAGVRVICSFIDDIYSLASMLAKQNDIRILETRDYIAEPKPNGYRSLHLIIEVPVFLSNRQQRVIMEVQIRTIAMDFWASLEHQLRYKKDLAQTAKIQEDLKQCAEIIAGTDYKMQEICNEIESEERNRCLS